jgi:hypothetical protein
MSKESGFRLSVTSLWFRLMALGIIAFVFVKMLILAPGKAQGWTFYLTAPEVAFEVAVRLIAAALAGIASGSVCTALMAPILWRFGSSREWLVTRATQVAVILVLFFGTRAALTALTEWLGRGGRFVPALLVAYCLTFAAALCFRDGRRELLGSLDGFLGEKATRRTAISAAIGAAALVATGFALETTPAAKAAALIPQRPKPNILLITFDALSAEDMSLYGYRLPTTPNIDAFAGKSTTFTNFYSASTFTTPSVATMLTGFHPSETHVHQLQGRLRGGCEEGPAAPDARRGLFHRRIHLEPVCLLPRRTNEGRLRLSA